MSLREELTNTLPPDVKIVNIDRGANINGLDAVEVEVTVPGTNRTLTSTFARKNGLTDQQIAVLVNSKLMSIMRELI